MKGAAYETFIGRPVHAGVRRSRCSLDDGLRCRGPDPKAPVGTTSLTTYITIENRSGNALAEGLIELVPSGVLAPFRRSFRASNPARNETCRDLFTGAGGAVSPRCHPDQGGPDHGQGYFGENLHRRSAVQLKAGKFKV